MGRPWKKLWVEKLRSSPKWRVLTLAEKGFYDECLMLCNDKGELKTADYWYSWRDIARDFNTQIRTARRIVQRLVDVDLLTLYAQLSDKIPKIVVTNAEQLQHVYTREPRRTNNLDQPKRFTKRTDAEVDAEVDADTPSISPPTESPHLIPTEIKCKFCEVLFNNRGHQREHYRDRHPEAV